MKNKDKKINIKKFIETLIIVLVVMIGSYAIIENFSYIFSFRYATQDIAVFNKISDSLKTFDSKVSKLNAMQNNVYELEDLQTLKTYFNEVNKDFTEMNNQIKNNKASNLIDYYSYVYIPSSIHDYKILEILSKYMTREEYMKNQNIFSMVRNINNYDINYFEVYKNFRYGFSSYDSPSVYIAINLMDRLAKITLEVGESYD